MRFRGCLLLAVCGIAGWVFVQGAWADTPPSKSSDTSQSSGSSKSSGKSRLAANLRPFDTNGDGKLDATERKAYNAAKKKGETAPSTGSDLDSALGRDKDGNKVAQPKSDSEKARELYTELRKKFDKDGDGNLDETERTAMNAEVEKMRAAGTLPEGFGRSRRGRGGPGGDRYAELRKKYDKNGDGQLDESERAAMSAAGEGFGGRGGPGGGGPGSDRFQAMIKRFDTDGDGQLDDTERAAMRAEFEKMRASGQFGGRRRGGSQSNGDQSNGNQ
jgi:uncharacterized membrane protein YebE (DUF533 family)